MNINVADPSSMEEEKVQLLALEENTRSILVDLVNFFSCKQNVKLGGTVIMTSSTPNIALYEVLQSQPKGCEEEMSKLTNLSFRKSCIFATTSPLTLNTTIDVKHWDITSLICLLEHVYMFPTSKEKFRKQTITCSGTRTANKHYKCCMDCKHPKSKSGSTFKCVKCKSPHEECFKKSTPCCNVCQICAYCTSRYGSGTTCICDNTTLRKSLDNVREMRNFIAHSSPSDYIHLRNGSFAYKKFPQIRDFQGLWNFLSGDVLFILDYLKSRKAIENSRYLRIADDVKTNILTLTKDYLCKQYQNCIDGYLAAFKAGILKESGLNLLSDDDDENNEIAGLNLLIDDDDENNEIAGLNLLSDHDDENNEIAGQGPSSQLQSFNITSSQVNLFNSCNFNSCNIQIHHMN